jgi:hypothetical protein
MAINSGCSGARLARVKGRQPPINTLSTPGNNEKTPQRIKHQIEKSRQLRKRRLFFSVIYERSSILFQILISACKHHLISCVVRPNQTGVGGGQAADPIEEVLEAIKISVILVEDVVDPAPRHR